jgi:hypothetical protein
MTDDDSTEHPGAVQLDFMEPAIAGRRDSYEASPVAARCRPVRFHLKSYDPYRPFLIAITRAHYCLEQAYANNSSRSPIPISSASIARTKKRRVGSKTKSREPSPSGGCTTLRTPLNIPTGPGKPGHDFPDSINAAKSKSAAFVGGSAPTR